MHRRDIVECYMFMDMYLFIASYPGLLYFSVLRTEKSGRPGRLCDVMLACGHYSGRD